MSLQDLIHDGIHAANRTYSRSLQILLSVIHDAKRLKEVDTMLVRTYGPLLWRSLQCANAQVRQQAAKLFFDLFPLQNPEDRHEDIERMLYRQMEVITSLLGDHDHTVRAIAVTGACYVLTQYWEIFPIEIINSEYLNYMIHQSSMDMSCPNIRIAVLKGISELIDNPLSRPLIKEHLPILRHCMFDKIERVSDFFLNLKIMYLLL